MRKRLIATSRFAWRWLRRALIAVTCLLLAVAGGFTAYALLALPALSSWHTEVLDGEFDADEHASLDFAGYQALEAALFERAARWAAQPAGNAPLRSTRFDPDSMPQRLAQRAPWNRSYRLAVTQGPVRGTALLVHGLTDSPYSVRALAETLHAQGFEVTALRLPGHGTLPSMLTQVRNEEWEAAVRLAARDVAARTPAGAPFYLGGYSTGATLALSHALQALDDPALRRPDRLLLIAPAVDIPAVAFFARVMDIAAVLPGGTLQKVKWQTVLPEYDPYKFNSFPVNATRQVRQATLALQARLQRAAQQGRLRELPPLIAWQSLVDSTIGARPLIDRVFARLDDPAHRLVLFDVNRYRGLAPVSSEAPRLLRERVLAQPRRWQLTLVTNRDEDTLDVHPLDVGARPASAAAPAASTPPLRWPNDVISLSHVALPFRPDDPVYGVLPGSGANGLPSLGSLALRGEEGALQFPLGSLARLRSNPFWAVIEDQVRQAVADDLARRPLAR
jgi:alpha-beta hydrolase superfamily lysophospholipase